MERSGLRLSKKKVFFLSFVVNLDLLAQVFGIGATIRIGQKMLCLPYADLFFSS